MKKSKIAIIFAIATVILLLINILIIIIFSFVNMKDAFYSSLNVASLSVSFLSLIVSSFFSLSVYLQAENQNKINDSLPKKDDQYIIANYSLFNLEKEISVFSLNENERYTICKNNKYLSIDDNNSNSNITESISRLVFLPTDSVNKPTYKVFVKGISFYSSSNQLLYSAKNINGVDCEYSSNILQRGYNCICVDIADNVNNVIVSLDKTNYIALELDVVSVFNVNMSIRFSVYLNGEKDNKLNPDIKIIPDLKTFNIHHTNYIIEEKNINKREI